MNRNNTNDKKKRKKMEITSYKYNIKATVVTKKYNRQKIQIKMLTIKGLIKLFRASDIVCWCGLTQLTSCRIQSHNQEKIRIIAQCRENGQFVKCAVIQTLFFTKNTAAFLNLVLENNMIFT